MASVSSASHLYATPFNSSVKLQPSFNGFNSNWRRHSLVFNCTSRTISCLSIRMTLNASLSSSRVKTEASDGGKRVSTLRELCHDHVPEHVIRRLVHFTFLILMPFSSSWSLIVELVFGGIVSTYCCLNGKQG